MIWFLLYVVLSFPAVWAMSKIDEDLAILTNDSGYRFIIAMGWPVFLSAALIFQLRYIWNLIYLKMFQGEKEDEKH